MENDLDGMDIRILPWTYSEEHLIFQISSSAFYEEYKRSFPENQPRSTGENDVHDFVYRNIENLSEDKYVLINLKVKD